MSLKIDLFNIKMFKTDLLNVKNKTGDSAKVQALNECQPFIIINESVTVSSRNDATSASAVAGGLKMGDSHRARIHARAPATMHGSIVSAGVLLVLFWTSHVAGAPLQWYTTTSAL